jgi:hypothetical protein
LAIGGASAKKWTAAPPPETGTLFKRPLHCSYVYLLLFHFRWYCCHYFLDTIFLANFPISKFKMTFIIFALQLFPTL